MAERDLLFLEDLAAQLTGFGPTACVDTQREIITHVHSKLNSSSSKIRNRLLRLTADSPDLLGVIKGESKV